MIVTSAIFAIYDILLRKTDAKTYNYPVENVSTVSVIKNAYQSFVKVKVEPNQRMVVQIQVCKVFDLALKMIKL